MDGGGTATDLQQALELREQELCESAEMGKLLLQRLHKMTEDLRQAEEEHALVRTELQAEVEHLKKEKTLILRRMAALVSRARRSQMDLLLSEEAHRMVLQGAENQAQSAENVISTLRAE
eukprot:RCo027283